MEPEQKFQFGQMNGTLIRKKTGTKKVTQVYETDSDEDEEEIEITETKRVIKKKKKKGKKTVS